MNIYARGALAASALLLVAATAPSPGTQMQVGIWSVRVPGPVDANFKSGDFSTQSKVYLTRNGGDVTADRASGNFNTRLINLYGHVVIHDNDSNFGSLTSGTHGIENHGPATLTADAVKIQGDAKTYTANGNVHYTQSDTVVDSDNGTLNDATHQLNLQGNVRVVQGERRLSSASLLYNTISGQAHAEGDPVTMQFPSTVNPRLATPRPIDIKNPLSKKPKPTPTP